MINLALYLRCKEEEFWVRVYKKALDAKTRIATLWTLVLGLLKSIVLGPLVLPIKLLVRFVFRLADDFGIDYTTRELCDKYCDLYEERKSLQREIEAKFN